MRLSLRDYQQKGADSIRESFRSGKRAPLFVSPTGSGKTVLFAYVTEGAARKGKRVVILTHRQELLDQTSRTLTDICVDHGLIASGEAMNQTEPVQVASVQTLVRRLDRVIPPDLIIIDEAHHAAAGSWRRIAAAYPNARILGVTATPERLDGKGLADVFDSLIRGPEVADLIRRGFLTQPMYFAPPAQFAESEMRTTAGDFNKHDAEVAVDKPRIVGDAVAHYARICPGVPAVAFCISIKHAEHVAEAFRAAGFRAATLDGTLSDFERRDRVAALGDGRLYVLTSCEIINEGFDLPVVTAAILLRPTQSLGLHLQQVGRVLRPVYAKGADISTDEARLMAIAAGGKPRAIILDHVANIMRHGLAEECREWALEGQAEKKKNKREGDAGQRLTQCPKCYGVHLPGPVCTCCGHTYEKKAREVDQVDGELVEIDTSMFGTPLSGQSFRQCPTCQHVHAGALDVCPKCGRNHAAAEGTAKRKEQGGAQTFADLVAVGKKRGMKQPHLWAAHVWKARHGHNPTAEERGIKPVFST